jgi:hypothetical protein
VRAGDGAAVRAGVGAAVRAGVRAEMIAEMVSEMVSKLASEMVAEMVSTMEAGRGAESDVAAKCMPEWVAAMTWRTDHQWLSPAVDITVRAKQQVMGRVEGFIACVGVRVWFLLDVRLWLRLGQGDEDLLEVVDGDAELLGVIL